MEDERKTRRRRHWGLFGPVVLILIGVVFLLERNGIISRQMLSQWWPLLLIFAGAWLLLDRLNR